MPSRRALSLRHGLAAHAAADSYRATKTDRARPIVRDGSGFRHADDHSRRLARELARDQDRSSALYRSIVTTFLDHNIGVGVLPIPTTEDPQWNDRASKLFADECDTLDIEGADTYGSLQRKWGRAVVNDGDLALIKLSDGKLVTVEADRIDGRRPVNQHRRLIGGVLLESLTGRRLEYGVCNYNIGGFVDVNRPNWYRADQVVWIGSTSRKSQVRSLPALVASLDDAERADSLIEAEIITAEQASMIWGWITNAQASAGGGIDPLASTNRDGSTALAAGDRDHVQYQNFVAGMLGFLGAGRDFKQAQTAKPNLNVVEFIKALMRLFSAEVGVPYELTLLDVGGLSWSSNQALLAFCERRQQVWRSQVFGPGFSEIWRWRVRSYIKRGLLKDRPDWYRHEHDWPAPPALNGPDQVTTDRGNLEIGRTSLHRLVGRNWAAVLREQAIEQRLRDELAVQRIAAVEDLLAPLRQQYPGLADLTWAHILSLGGAITAPGAFLNAANPARPASETPPASPAPEPEPAP